MYSLSRPLRFAALAVAALALDGLRIDERELVPRARERLPAVPDLQLGSARRPSRPVIPASTTIRSSTSGFRPTSRSSWPPEDSRRRRQACPMCWFAITRASISGSTSAASIAKTASATTTEEACRPYVYDADTLLIDFVDTRTDKVVWRGWTEGSVDGAIDNQRLMEQKVDKAVTRILEQLPRRL